MYLHVHFSLSQVSALLDTDSSINLMSEELFSILPSKSKMFNNAINLLL